MPSKTGNLSPRAGSARPSLWSSWTNKYTVIKKSSVHGVGVFAKEDIPRGTKIADYYGKEMKWKTFKRRYGDYKSNSLNTYPMRRQWRIIVAKDEPYRSRNLVNFINERQGNPNCELKLRALYAKTDIKKGDELFLHYPRNYNRFWSKTVRTLRKSPKPPKALRASPWRQRDCL